MSWLARLGQGLGVSTLSVLGVLLLLESTGVIGGQWRRDLASIISDIAYPTWPLWVSVVVGVTLGVVGIALAVAQLLPGRRGLSALYQVSDGDVGSTWIRGGAAAGAVRHELADIEGVAGVDVRLRRQQLVVEAEVADTTNIDAFDDDVRHRLDHGFWTDLGLADFTVNLLITHRHGPPPRVQ